MKKTFAILLAVLLLTAMLPFAAVADDTVTQSTDENGNPITIITDEAGNETIIRQVEPGADDITFDEDDFEFEDGDPADTAAPDAADPDASAEPGAAAGSVSWGIPAAIAGVLVVAIALVLILRKKK